MVVLHPILITDTLNLKLRNAPPGKLLIGLGGHRNQTAGASKKKCRRLFLFFVPVSCQEVRVNAEEALLLDVCLASPIISHA